MARDTRNVVVAGDRVLYRPQRDGTGIIERVEPRESTISRGSHGRAHVLVANVDQVLVVVSAADPPLKPGLIDRFLVAAGQAHVRAVIVINKVDLVGVETLQPLAGIYGGLGYTVVLCSATTGFGIDALRAILRNKHSVVAGQSGVGKSSLLNAVQPDFQLRTGPVSNWNRKGRHTSVMPAAKDNIRLGVRACCPWRTVAGWRTLRASVSGNCGASSRAKWKPISSSSGRSCPTATSPIAPTRTKRNVRSRRPSPPD